MASISLKIFGSADPNAGYIGWTPVPLTVEGVSSSGTKSVTLKSRSLNGSISKLVFVAQAGDDPKDEITIDLGAADRAVILVAGKFQNGERHNGASEDSKDVAVDAVWADDPGETAGSLNLMIRVRKNANELSKQAREDFLNALATLNGIQTGTTPTVGAGKGVYVTDFVRTHVRGSYANQHGDSMFLPWHRLYLLDLERLLQKENPAVTLPYWKFDEAAPNVFATNFMGATEFVSPPPATPFTPGTSDMYASFDSANPLSQWKIDDDNDIQRAAFFDTLNAPGYRIISDGTTLGLGNQPSTDPNAEFGPWVFDPVQNRMVPTKFSRIEVAPHGSAHTSFNGFVNYPPVAPRDPLFFLLHCNVDRLWALWQFTFQRDVAHSRRTYPYQSGTDVAESWKVITSLQWPWDGTNSADNLPPPPSRRANFTSSPTGKPIAGAVPSLIDAIDAFGVHDQNNYLGFAYDDVRFDFNRSIASPIL